MNKFINDHPFITLLVIEGLFATIINTVSIICNKDNNNNKATVSVVETKDENVIKEV